MLARRQCDAAAEKEKYLEEKWIPYRSYYFDFCFNLACLTSRQLLCESRSKSRLTDFGEDFRGLWKISHSFFVGCVTLVALKCRIVAETILGQGQRHPKNITTSETSLS